MIESVMMHSLNLVIVVKGCSKIDSIVLGQHAVYNNLEKRKREEEEEEEEKETGVGYSL
jgi:hypothetical protein